MIEKNFCGDNLIDLLELRASQRPTDILYRFLSERFDDVSILRYAELAGQAKAIAVELTKNAMPGDRVLLIYPPGLELIAASFGCIYAGLIAIPIYPPVNIKLAEKLQRIIVDATPSLIASTQDIAEKVKQFKFFKHLDFEKLAWVYTDRVALNQAEIWHKPSITNEQLAFLQYTSGSTGNPKGVMLSHQNLLHNLQLIREGFSLDTSDSIVSWLPPYHDMGLIGNILSALYVGMECTLMSPVTFLQNPVRWLQTISDYKANISGAPNFAYDYCTRKITDEQCSNLNLGDWQLAFNGAEPIHPQVLQCFSERFKTFGFNPKAFYPCYGLAEATLFVAGAKRSQGYETTQHTGKQLINCGRCVQNVAIVNPDTQILCNDTEIGEIWVEGDSIAKGYWGNAQATRETFTAHLHNDLSTAYLRTGDLGFIKDQNLYVTGRIKDLIIIHGVNYYPQDIEYTVENCHAQIRYGCCAVFPITVGTVEHLVVVCEVDRLKDEADYVSVCQSIHRAVIDHHQLAVYSIVLISPKSLPKTTSGKKRRRETKTLFQEHKLKVLYEWMQKTNSAVSAIDEPIQDKTPIEMQLVQIYMQVFEQQSIHLTNHFFDLGGDSLSVMQLIARIRETWGIELDMQCFFKDPSVAEVAKMIENALTAPISQLRRSDALPAVRRDEKIPLSFAQQRLWFLHQLHPEHAFYNLGKIMHIKGQLNISVLEKAIQTIIVRHEILRTAFLQMDGQPYQHILPAADFHLLQEHFVDNSMQTAAQQTQVFMQAKIAMPFDLSTGNLLRAYLLTMNNETSEFILLLVVHHIIVDGGSLEIFMDELSQLYNAYTQHLSKPLPQLERQYADYCQWQQTQAAVIEKQLLFWQQQLQDAPPLLMLPIDKPRPHVASFQGASSEVVLVSQTVKKLKSLAQQQGCSLYMVLLTIFEVLLYRYTQQTDMVVGSAVAQRHHPGVKNLIGFFVNTLALRAKIADTPTPFLTQLAQTRQTLFNALANQEAPFEQVVQTLNIPRHLSFNPLIQVMFVLQNNTKSALELPDLNITVDADSLMARFDLTLECIEANDHITCRFEYATDLFEDTTIQRLAQHFITLTECIAKNPHADIHTLDFLGQQETQQMLNTWNATESDYPKDQSIQQLFEEQVKKTPNHIAVVFVDTRLTYSALNAQANRLARYLRDIYQIKANDLVALCLERSEQMLIAILAVLKAGAAYVPIDASYPEERISFILGDTKAKLLLTQAIHHNSLIGMVAQKQLSTQVQAMDSQALSNSLTMYSTADLTANITSNHLAYVIYTSGTTGQPKGVMVTHKNVVNLLHMQAKTLGLFKASQDKPLNCLWYANYVFDAHVWELFAVICTGHVIHVAAEAIRQDVRVLSEYIKAQHIAIATLPPALLSLDWLPALQTLIVAGEKTEQKVLAYYKSHHINIINAYGPTETTVCATLHHYQQHDLNTQIGKPIANTTIYILDRYLNPLPIGAIGELFIGGEGVAQGYLNLPELTQERFIDNPFQTAKEKQLGSNAKLFRSGDLARYLPDGSIEYIGRNDTQVKIRGFRIELKEIEAKLASYPGVKQAVVLLKERVVFNSYPKYLVGYYTAKRMLDEAVMLTYLRQLLPEYMLPNSLVWLPEFPLTVNGKLDYKALPEPVYQRRLNYRPPSNSVEKQIASIWHEILKVEPIGVDDNFFEIGGHSLLGVRLVQKIEQVFQRRVPVADLFSHPTIKSMAQLYQEDNNIKM
ncbi:MAG TPA: amino acid adenylation domain-containing protein [Gammaproteobacteria bacterium]|nr:amino acid adenylation domain-containing protein [Gammaproteobacteria bacterium]